MYSLNFTFFNIFWHFHYNKRRNEQSNRKYVRNPVLCSAIPCCTFIFFVSFFSSFPVLCYDCSTVNPQCVSTSHVIVHFNADVCLLWRYGSFYNCTGTYVHMYMWVKKCLFMFPLIFFFMLFFFFFFVFFFFITF